MNINKLKFNVIQIIRIILSYNETEVSKSNGHENVHYYLRINKIRSLFRMKIEVTLSMTDLVL